MTSFEVPVYSETPEALKEVYDKFQKTIGFVPNLYATIGYSPNALNAYAEFAARQSKGTFHAKDREAIYLIVSQLNGCHYCLASHTESAIAHGWPEEETLEIRKGTHPELKWQVLYRVIKSVIENKGAVDRGLLEAFSSLGYGNAALMDLISLIMVMSLTNYVYRLTQIPIDYPLAKEI
ncbi:carboxymuconolactone decarboxylase family protein [Mucilaginibacter celer]|uniref:Carboxymuconolactone decarboxylase family protein n=1 Tax=Mucilaginibacter celer TaxID=2305508 RepID=A0A494VSD9_9SPHI|nr:carboxymuconolactone decarboxylase family protein [Mucilaginibacter celer]AYL94298.1 carboxymuconolactone decarboxylase family protein [Mucilaginibacter celer]